MKERCVERGKHPEFSMGKPVGKQLVGRLSR
jgi:hypothetical protein